MRYHILNRPLSTGCSLILQSNFWKNLIYRMHLPYLISCSLLWGLWLFNEWRGPCFRPGTAKLTLLTRFLTAQAESLELPWRITECVAGKPIFILTWEGTEPTLPSLLLNSHTGRLKIVLEMFCRWYSTLKAQKNFSTIPPPPPSGRYRTGSFPKVSISSRT